MNEDFVIKSETALNKLAIGNDIYVHSCHNPAYISQKRRTETTQNGQNPYAVILTCSDSRVSPEHIFSAGIGDLFVVRTAGNVVGKFELGSIEYAVQQLNAPIIVVMGHTHCGAVSAALEGYANGYINDIIHEIQLGLNGAKTEDEAICNNILHSQQQVLQSKTVNCLVEAGQLMVVSAEYNIETGHVYFFNDC